MDALLGFVSPHIGAGGTFAMAVGGLLMAVVAAARWRLAASPWGRAFVIGFGLIGLAFVLRLGPWYMADNLGSYVDDVIINVGRPVAAWIRDVTPIANPMAGVLLYMGVGLGVGSVMRRGTPLGWALIGVLCGLVIGVVGTVLAALMRGAPA